MDNGTLEKVGAPRKRKIFWEKIRLCLGVSRRDLWALGGQAPLGSPGYLEVEARCVVREMVEPSQDLRRLMGG